MLVATESSFAGDLGGLGGRIGIVGESDAAAGGIITGRGVLCGVFLGVVCTAIRGSFDKGTDFDSNGGGALLLYILFSRV